MFSPIPFLFYAFCIVNGMHLENWTILKEKISASSLFLDGPMRLRVYSTCKFAMPFQIGNSGQHFNLSLDFFFSYTILALEDIDYEPSSKADPQAYQRNILDPKTSSTFYNYSEEFSDLFYGTGYFAEDNMDFQQSTKNHGPRMDLMLLTDSSDIMAMAMNTLPADGYLGLAPTPSGGFGMETFVDWLMKKQGKNSTKITFYLAKFNPYDPNEMAQNSFAMVDFSGNSLPEYCQEEKWFLNDRPTMPIPYYQMVVKTVSLQPQENAKAQIIIAKNETFYVSPTLFFTIMPEKKVSVLANMVGAKNNGRGLYKLPCNATKNAPTVKFEFSNSQREEMVVEFAPEEYILPYDHNGDKCFLIFAAIPDADASYLGYSFFQGHNCLQLNYDGNSGQVGLAPIKKSLN